MIQGIDHVVILVEDLARDSDQYRDLGFKVVQGGRHPRGTHNALIGFSDGSYIELIAFWEPDYTEHPWHRHQALGPGIVDYALAISDAAAVIEETRSHGLKYAGPWDGARSRPDGVEVQWRGAIRDGEDEALPFLIEDVTDRQLRVPGGEDAMHPNGVTGIERLIVVTQNVPEVTRRMSALLGIEPVADPSTMFDQRADSAAFVADGHRLEFHQPHGNGPLAERLALRGPGPYAMVFRAKEARSLRPDATGGARLEFVTR